LAYHRVSPEDKISDLLEEMNVQPEDFERQVKYLKSNYRVLPLTELTDNLTKDINSVRNTVAITFDDAYSDNYEFAFPILRELEAPATIFLVSDMIGTSKQFWPERLALILSNIAQDHSSHWSHPSLDWIKKPSTCYQFTTIPPTQEELSELIANAKALPDDEIHIRLDKIEQALKLSLQDHQASLLNWQQISEMNTSGLVEVGSHTCSHTRLNNATDDDVLKHEIIDSKRQIEEKTGQSVKTFCFPNGDYSSRALELVRQHYEVGVSTETGWNSSASDNYLLHRIGIHEDIAKDETAFLARISGWM